MLRSITLFLVSMFFVQDCCAKTITLNSNNFVSLVGPVSRSSVDDVIKGFSSKNVVEYIQDNKQINLYLNTPGGSVFAGNHLIQYINTLRENNIQVDCIAQNFMSMGFIIMQSCSKRYVMFDSIGMQHQMSLGMKGSIENFKAQFNLIERVNDHLTEMEIKRINITKSDYLSKILSDWWLYGIENVVENVADELINVKCSPTIVNEKVKKQESFFGFDIEIEMSKCPVLNDIKIIEKNSERNGTTPVLKESNTTNVEKFYDFDNYIHNVKDIIIKF
jgi:ATP-dependent protease ClpP protease subunit